MVTAFSQRHGTRVRARMLLLLPLLLLLLLLCSRAAAVAEAAAGARAYRLGNVGVAFVGNRLGDVTVHHVPYIRAGQGFCGLRNDCVPPVVAPAGNELRIRGHG